MQIRSITLFCDNDFAPETATRFFGATESRFHLPLQTRRVALPPFPTWWKAQTSTTAQAKAIAFHWRQVGADYVSLGPVRLVDDAGWLGMLVDILGAGDTVFAAAEIADTEGHLDVGRCHAVAEVIRGASSILEGGFGNLYFAALANCPAGSPFFPVAYHGGGSPSFALAVEAADLAVSAFDSAPSLAAARDRLVAAIEAEAEALSKEAAALAAELDISFSGLDFSLAPFPKAGRSLAQAMESLGLPTVGARGSLFAAAFIAEAIDRARFPRCGFSGLMLTVLEDHTLAARAASGNVALSDLLSFAAVCGVGLDTIPLPGDIPPGTLAGILLDVAALGVRLDKPLTARLMPLPGHAAGEPVHFDFPYFADGAVMNAPGGSIRGLLQQPATLPMLALDRSRRRNTP